MFLTIVLITIFSCFIGYKLDKIGEVPSNVFYLLGWITAAVSFSIIL